MQGATDRRERREVPSSFEKHQSGEEVKRADPQRVKTADPQRVRKGQFQRDDEHLTTPQRRPQSRSPGLMARQWRTRSRIPWCETWEARTGGTSETSLPRRSSDLIYVTDSSNQDEVEDAKEDCRGSTGARHGPDRETLLR